MGDNLTLVVGDRNLKSLDSIEGPEGLENLDVAIAMRSDRAAATKLAHTIAAAVSKFGGFDLAVLSTKDGAVLATNKDFAADFNQGKKLAGSDAFQSVIPQDKSTSGGFFLDLAKVIEVARGMDVPDSDKKDLDQVKDLKALGFSSTKDGDRVIRGTLKLSFSD